MWKAERALPLNLIFNLLLLSRALQADDDDECVTVRAQTTVGPLVIIFRKACLEIHTK